jgi:hypothetical protein
MVCNDLKESMNVDISVEDMERIFEENAFLFVYSPQKEYLYAGQKNQYKVIPTFEDVRIATEGRNWNNATIVSAAVLRGDHLRSF